MLRKRQKRPKTTYAFIDSQNLNLGTQRVGWKLDWRKFRQYLKDKHGVTKAYTFIGYMSENEAMYEYMHELGYLVVLKPTVDMNVPKDLAQKDETAGRDDKDKPTIKGNVDAELVLYAMKELLNYDQAIIVSGDGDFFTLAEYLEEKGKLAHIIAPNWQYSSLLKAFDSKIIRLDQFRREFTYHDRKDRKKKK